MSELVRREGHEAVVPGFVVLGRVWLGGLLWGPVGGTLFAMLGFLPEMKPGDVQAFVAAAIVFPLIFGAPAGLVIGVVMAPVAALVLLSRRPDADVSPTVATLVTLGLFVFLAGLAAEDDVVLAWAVASLIGLIAARPMHHTLRRALRPTGRPTGRPA